LQLLDFLEKTTSGKTKELERITLLIFYHFKMHYQTAFNMKQISCMAIDAGYSLPNASRLKYKLLSNRVFKLDKYTGNIEFLPVPLQKFEKKYSGLFNNTVDIKSDSEFLDETKFCGYRGYMDKLIKQINSSYSNNCYDACVVLMRRLFEICLILSYQKLGIDSQIKNQNNTYFLLERIVANARSNAVLNLSRIKEEYDKIRNLGNWVFFRDRSTSVMN